MVLISQINIKNFKFFHNEIIDLKKNVLFYGENGSGKSSLYWALKIYFENKFGIINSEEYAVFFNKENPKNIRNRNFFDLEPEILITPVCDDASKNTIHFINHLTLSKLFSSDIDGSLNFFDILNNEWFQKYSFFDSLRAQNISIDTILTHEKKVAFDEELQEKIQILLILTNDILKNNFEEKVIQLDYRYEGIELKTIERESIDRVEKYPIIQILVNDIVNPQHHFNEAKLKLISLALHFAIIELSKPDEHYNGLRLAVFDDFLQSLDMSYRSVVLDYIFQIFIERDRYQIIMLTHDLMFYKLLKRKTELYNQTSDWEYNSIYVRETIEKHRILIEPKIYGLKDYFEEAKSCYDENKLEECGNLLRKELESTLSALIANLTIGHREMSQQMINYIQADSNHFDVFYFESHLIIYQLKDKVKTCINILENAKRLDCPQKIDKIIQLLKKELDSFCSYTQIDTKNLKAIMKGLNYHKDTLLNTTSHVNEEDLIRGEFKKAIEDIKKLKELIDATNR